MSAHVSTCDECGKPTVYEQTTFVWRHSESGSLSCSPADLNAARASWPLCRYCCDPVRPGPMNPSCSLCNRKAVTR